MREKEDKFRQRTLVNWLHKKNDDTTTGTFLNERNVEDMEDFLNIKGDSTDKPRPVVHHYEGNGKHHLDRGICQINSQQKETNGKEIEHPDSLSMQKEAMPMVDIDRNLDYQGWLEMKKRKWREALDRRKRQRYIVLCYLLKICSVCMRIVLVNCYHDAQKGTLTCRFWSFQALDATKF